MSRKLKVNVNVEMMNQAEDEFAYVYGRTMSAWADIERSLYHWFWYITRLKDGMARGIYFGTRGFGIRLDMLEAAIEHADEVPQSDKDFIIKAVNKARSYSTFRNTIAHGEPVPTVVHTTLKETDVVEDGEPKELSADAIHFQIVQARDIEGKGISIQDMARAHDRFMALAHAINGAVPHHRKDKPLARYLELVNALPNQPDSKNDQTHEGSAQQPQEPVHRNKKAHRAAQKEAKADRAGGE